MTRRTFRPRVPTLRSVGLLAAGVVTALSLGPWGWWPLAIIGLAWLHHSTVDIVSRRSRWATAWMFMCGYHVLGLAWMVDLTAPGYVVSIPVLSAVMATPFAVVGRPQARVLMFPAALVVAEAWSWVFPFGGVPMANLALGQVDGPFMVVARAFGALGLIAVLAMAAVAVGELALSLADGERRPTRSTVVLAAVVAAALAIGTVAPSGTAVDTITASTVQGGGRLGTNAVNSDLGSVYDRHLDATADVPDGALVVWPESAVTVDNDFDGSREQLELSALAIERNLTLIVGVTQRRDLPSGPGVFDNLAVVIGPDGRVIDEYSKVHLVPFGEYVPLRSFVDRFADLSLIPREAVAGSGPGVVDTPIGPVGVAISFEVYFTERVRSGIVDADALLVVNPTLASSYRTTHVPEQSLASARLRAVETGRWVIQSSTTGYSAIVDPDGHVVGRTGLKEQRVITAEVELRTGQTWPMRTGKLPITIVALAVLLGSAQFGSASLSRRR